MQRIVIYNLYTKCVCMSIRLRSSNSANRSLMEWGTSPWPMPAGTSKGPGIPPAQFAKEKCPIPGTHWAYPEPSSTPHSMYFITVSFQYFYKLTLHNFYMQQLYSLHRSISSSSPSLQCFVSSQMNPSRRQYWASPGSSQTLFVPSGQLPVNKTKNKVIGQTNKYSSSVQSPVVMSWRHWWRCYTRRIVSMLQ